MDTRQISGAIRGLKANSVRVYVADRIPKHLSLPTAIIVNTDTSDKPGTHWVALYIDKNASGSFSALTSPSRSDQEELLAIQMERETTSKFRFASLR